MFSEYGVVNFWIYFSGAVAIVLVPGPNSMYVLSESVRAGMRNGFIASLGITVGDVLLCMTAFLGVAGLLEAHPMAFTIMKWGGAIYLGWLGLNAFLTAFRRKRNTAEDAKSVQGADRRGHPFMKSFALSVTNPKSILFYMSFFLQFIDTNYAHPTVTAAVLVTVLEVVSLVFLSFLIAFGQLIPRYFEKRPMFSKIGHTAIGSLFIGFAAELANS